MLENFGNKSWLIEVTNGHAQFFFVQQTLEARRDRMIPQLGFLWFPPQQVGFKCSWFMGLVKMLVYIAYLFHHLNRWENIELWGILRRPFKIQGDGPE